MAPRRTVPPKARRLGAVLGVAASGLVLAGDVSAQVLRGAADTVAEPPDPSTVLGRARRAQADFEIRRIRLLPARARAGPTGECDEVVGRFCTWFNEDDWVPEPDPGELTALRDRLVAHLDSAQGLLPGDGWVQGQRVWYRVEARRWDEALAAASSCGAEPWWCAALRGLALHGLGRYPEARAAFQAALDRMEPERAERWRDPRMLLTSGARRALGGPPHAEPGPALARLWALADPLVLVPGNDRETEHYARWTVASLKEDARNPYRTRWGRDLEELTVRMGWEVGWERARDAAGREWMVGHQHPEGRDYLPHGALADPAAAPADEFVADRDERRSFYAPAVAPLVLPMDGQVAVFPRGGSMAVVGTWRLPPDTTRREVGGPPRPWMEPGDQAGRPVRAGLFLIPLDGGAPRGAETEGETEGAVVMEVPAGGWVASVEVWDPPARRAGRLRTGIRSDSVPPDVPVLSDLLLVRGGGEDPQTLAEAARGALPVRALEEAGPLGVVWEMGGLGWAREDVAYRLSAERAGAGVLRRLGRALRLVGPEPSVSLSWSEPGPDRPVSVLRRVELDLSGAPPGTYVVTLRAALPGRQELVSRAQVELVREVDDPPRRF